MAEDVAADKGEKQKVKGRFLNLATNLITGRPTATLTVTALTFVTEIAIERDDGNITFADGQCVPPLPAQPARLRPMKIFIALKAHKSI